ncbi:MAG: hypothetical protein UH678_00645 [Fibrobacteraceae bacterium]|nr:hypothetical protein [Fibrobacteraceae bacterium]
MKDDCEIVRKLLDERAMNLALDAMALDLVRLHPEAENLIVMGMATRGIPLANEISQRLTLRYGNQFFLAS